MSMAAEERKAWAHDRLTNYLRDVEVSEFLDQLADVTHLEDRVCDLEFGAEDMTMQLTRLEGTTDTLADRVDELEEVVQDIQQAAS